MFVVAFRLMHDIGFTPQQRPATARRDAPDRRRLDRVRLARAAGQVADGRLRSFTGGVGIYAFYALQPYLLELYGDPEAYAIAGSRAAIVAGAQILGGIAAPRIRGCFRRRTSALLIAVALSSATLALIGLIESFCGGDRPGRRLGPAVRRQLTDPPGLHERHDPLAAAGDDPLVRLDAGLDRRRLGAARARPRRRRLGLRAALPARRRDLGLALPFIALSRRQNTPADISVAGAEPEPPEPYQSPVACPTEQPAPTHAGR